MDPIKNSALKLQARKDLQTFTINHMLAIIADALMHLLIAIGSIITIMPIIITSLITLPFTNAHDLSMTTKPSLLYTQGILLFAFILGYMAQLSLKIAYYDFTKQNTEISADHAFCHAFVGFSRSYFWPLLKVAIISYITIDIGYRIFFIPGIMITIYLSQVPYIINDVIAHDNEITAINVIKRSIKLVNNHACDYFMFKLTFIGWILLEIITLGIACLWVKPYIMVSEVYYYKKLIELKKYKLNNQLRQSHTKLDINVHKQNNITKQELTTEQRRYIATHDSYLEKLSTILHGKTVDDILTKPELNDQLGKKVDNWYKNDKKDPD